MRKAERLQNNDRFVPKPLRFKCSRILSLFCVICARLVKGLWLFALLLVVIFPKSPDGYCYAILALTGKLWLAVLCARRKNASAFSALLVVSTERRFKRTAHLPQARNPPSFPQTKKASVCLLFLVGRGGFEPPKSVTTDLQSAPFGHSGIFPYFGAGDRNRTNNLLITNQLLCLLSYTSAPQYAVVPRGGLEPPTRGFSVPCYYQLSYRGKKMAIRKGLEPSTSSVTG